MFVIVSFNVNRFPVLCYFRNQQWMMHIYIMKKVLYPPILRNRKNFSLYDIRTRFLYMYLTVHKEHNLYKSGFSFQ